MGTYLKHLLVWALSSVVLLINELMKWHQIKHLHSHLSVSLTTNLTNTIQFGKLVHMWNIYFQDYFEIQYMIFNYFSSVYST